MTYICENCGKAFHRSPSKIGERCFCSRACSQQQRPRKGEMRTCPTCGKEFYVYPSYTGRVGPRDQTHCSRACLGATLTLACQVCGQIYRRKTSQLQGVVESCCSSRCAGVLKQRRYRGEGNGNWRGGKIAVSCAGCGRPLLREPNQIARGRQFCSRECKGRWMESQTGENHPRYQGGRIDYYGPNWLQQKRAARQRDNNCCQCCGISKTELGRELDVHHLKPFRSFGYIQGENEHYLQANDLNNLVTLCPKCHRIVESGRRTVLRQKAP